MQIEYCNYPWYGELFFRDLVFHSLLKWVFHAKFGVFLIYFVGVNNEKWIPYLSTIDVLQFSCSSAQFLSRLPLSFIIRCSRHQDTWDIFNFNPETMCSLPKNHRISSFSFCVFHFYGSFIESVFYINLILYMFSRSLQNPSQHFAVAKKSAQALDKDTSRLGILYKPSQNGSLLGQVDCDQTETFVTRKAQLDMHFSWMV